MSTQEEIKAIRDRTSQVERKRAVAESNRDQAQKKLDEVWNVLSEKYGISNEEQLNKAIQAKELELSVTIENAKSLLDEAEGQ